MPDKKFISLIFMLMLACTAIAGTEGAQTTAFTSGDSFSLNSLLATSVQDRPSNSTLPGGTPPSNTAPNGTPPDGAPPGSTPMNGTPPGGAAPGGSSGSSSYNLSGVYTVDGVNRTMEKAGYTSDTNDVSAVYVLNGGDLTLDNPTIRTSGDTSSNDASSFFGLNAAVLVTSGSHTKIDGGSITTSGTGANGVISTGAGSSVVLSGVTITATGNGGHGVMATNTGSIQLTDVDMTTSGSNSAPLATDRGSGTVTATGGTIISSGIDSPGIYSTGDITVNSAKITARGAEAAVIEGANSITLTDTTISGAKGTRDRGVMLYQSMSGDAETGTSSFTMNGGSLTWPSASGPVFYVTNTKSVIHLRGTTIVSSSDKLLDASAGNWGTSGSNGGTVTFVASGETLKGSITADTISQVTASLQKGTTLTGYINSAALELDSESRWVVTGDSVLTSLADTSGISGTSISNIIGNGFTVTYDANLSANSELGGKTYSLEKGGKLVPKQKNTRVTPPASNKSSISFSKKTSGDSPYISALFSKNTTQAGIKNTSYFHGDKSAGIRNTSIMIQEKSVGITASLRSFSKVISYRIPAV